MSVVLETTVGDLTLDLYLEDRPKTCMNFMKLCKTKAYNMNLFHMVQPDFIAQTGDPAGTGRGGDSVFCQLYGPQARYFEAETVPRIKHTRQGLISMVNCGDNMLGSQFFITLGDDLDYLDNEHCVFGEVVEGEEVLEKFNSTIVDGVQRPYQDIRITHTVILHDPYPDPTGLELRSESPEPTEELLKSSRIGADENINDYAGKTDEEINEIIAEKEARARATILEMVGDLPDADVAPPENVLFVCKLNPVTSDDDLEIIFSRFGKVKCCEVIRDRISEESLQYAFVEFEDTAACEQAYFKMDNVLIDDRRIHVDFSQSVSKYRWKGKGRLEVFEGDEKEGKGRAVSSRACFQCGKEGHIARDCRGGGKDENDLKDIIEKERRVGRENEDNKDSRKGKSRDTDSNRDEGERRHKKMEKDERNRSDRNRSDRDKSVRDKIDRNHYRNNRNNDDRNDRERSDRDKNDRDKDRSDRNRNDQSRGIKDRSDRNRSDYERSDKDRSERERSDRVKTDEKSCRDRNDRDAYDRNGYSTQQTSYNQRENSRDRKRSDAKDKSKNRDSGKTKNTHKRNKSSSSGDDTRRKTTKSKKNKSRYSSSDSSDTD